VRKLHVDDLARLRVPLKHVLPFVTVPGHKGGGLLDSMGLEGRLKPAAEQLQLFPTLMPT
jgi:predicted DNA-binding helix-hairpin-helix protein